MTNQEIARVLTVLRDLHNALTPFRVQHHHGSTYCKYCGANQGEWVEDDPNWVPVHTEECPIGRAVAILQQYPEREETL